MWRVGKGLLTHVFCGDQPAAVCDTPEIAARIVAAMNAAEATPRTVEIGRFPITPVTEGDDRLPQPSAAKAQPELDAGRICRHGKIELECGTCGPDEPARMPLDPLSFEASVHYANKANEPARKAACTMCNGDRFVGGSTCTGCHGSGESRKAVCGTCGAPPGATIISCPRCKP